MQRDLIELQELYDQGFISAVEFRDRVRFLEAKKDKPVRASSRINVTGWINVSSLDGTHVVFSHVKSGTRTLNPVEFDLPDVDELLTYVFIV
jgi:hypothetical protein